MASTSFKYARKKKGSVRKSMPPVGRKSGLSPFDDEGSQTDDKDKTSFLGMVKSAGERSFSFARKSKKPISNAEQGASPTVKMKIQDHGGYTNRTVDSTAIDVVKREGSHRWRQLGVALLGSYMDDIDSILAKKRSDEDRTQYILQGWCMKMGNKATIKELLRVCDRSDINIKRPVWSGLVSIPVTETDEQDGGHVDIHQSSNLHFVKVGNSVKLHCQAIGSADPVTYQWYLNDDIMPDENKETVDAALGGSYHCVVSGTFGAKISDPIEVLLVRKLASDRIAAQGTEAMLHYYRSNNLIVTTPEEVLSLGKKVQRAFLEAIRTNGCVRCPRVRLMVVGQDRAGKTSFIKALLHSLSQRRSMVGSTDSTSGIEISLVKCHLYDKECKFEVVEGLETEVQAIKKLQAHHIAELILQQSLHPKKEDSSVSKPPLSPKIPIHSSATKDKPIMTAEQATSVPKESEEVDKPNQQDEMLSEHWKTQLDEEMSKLVTEELRALKEYPLPPHHQHPSSSDLSDYLWLRLYDFAGQPIYYNTHACFMTSHGVYVIVHNLEKNLDDLAVVCIGHGGKEFIIEDGCGTNRDYLQTWMTAVSITESVVGSASTTLTPSAIMVGTHYDIIKQCYPNLSERAQFLTAKEAAIDRVVNRFPLSCHFRRPFFYVDNLFTCDDAEDQLLCVRRKIVDLALEDKQSEGLIPFSWLRFEADVYTESSRNPDGYWSYHEAIERASQCFSLQNLGNEEHLQSMFQFYHRLGVIMWFGESAALSQYVVINPQLLLNLFRSIITLDPALDDRKAFWEALRNTGILDYKYMDKMLEESVFANQKVTAVSSQSDIAERKDFLLKMLQMFGLSVPYLQSSSAVNSFHSGFLSQSSQFLIPSMINRDLPIESFAQQLDSCLTIYLTSLHRLVPTALYSRLVVYLVRLFPLCPAIYRQFARLHIDRNYDLLLFNINTEQSGRIKLAIQRLDCDVTVAQSVAPSRILKYAIQAIADIKSQGMQGLQFVLETEVACCGTQPVHQHFFPAFDFECNKHNQESCADPVCLDQVTRNHRSKRCGSGIHVRCGVNQCPNGLEPCQGLQQWFDSWTTHADSKMLEVCIVSGSFETTHTGHIIAGDITVREGGGMDTGHHQNVTVMPDILQGAVQLCCSTQHCESEADTIKYNWFKGGVAVGESSCLEVKSFTACKDSGVYCCQVVSNRDYSYSQPVFIQAAPGKLILKEPPAVEIFIISATLRRVKEKSPVSLGQTIQLVCTAQSIEPDVKLYYQWFQNKLSIPHAVDSSFVIESVQDFHDGLYHCIVSDHPLDPASVTSSSISSSRAEIIIASHNWRDDECWFQHQAIQRRKQIQVATYKAYRAKATDKVALLIGNREYTRVKGEILFPENDVVAVADALRCLSFKVLVYVNLSFFEMCHVLQMFYELVRQGVYAVFYFAGHGFEFNRETYLMPVDADLGNIKTSFRETAIEYALQECGARLGLLLLDCCRVWPGYGGRKCVLPSLGVGNMITQYSCCSLNPAYEVSSAGSNHSVYASQLKKVLEKVAASVTHNTERKPGHESKTVAQMVGRDNEDSVDSDRPLSIASMPSQAGGEAFKLSVQNMLEAVAIAVNDERVSQRQGGRDTPWQVPQLKEHIIEIDLSLADQVDTHGDIARQNERHCQALNSLIPPGKKVVGNCQLCQVYLNYEMWTGNVLLIGINVIPHDQDLTDKLKVEMQVKFDSSSHLQSVPVSGHELDLVVSKTDIAGCSHYMKIYNIQRLQCDEEMVVVVNISAEPHFKHCSLETYIGSEWLSSTLQYSHGQKFPLSSLASKLRKCAHKERPPFLRGRSSSLPEVFVPVGGKP